MQVKETLKQDRLKPEDVDPEQVTAALQQQRDEFAKVTGALTAELAEAKQALHQQRANAEKLVDGATISLINASSEVTSSAAELYGPAIDESLVAAPSASDKPRVSESDRQSR